MQNYVLNRRSTTDRLLELSVLLYTLAVFLVTPVPGLSRLTHACLALVILILCLKGLRGRIYFPREPGLACAMALIAFSFASILWSVDTSIALAHSLTLAVSVTGYIAVVVAFKNGLTLRPIIIGAFIGASVNAIIGISQAATGDYIRADGLTGNANALALQLAMAALIVLSTARPKVWVPTIFALAFIAIATFVSGSRKVVAIWIMVGAFLGRGLWKQLLRSTGALGIAIMMLPIVIIALITFVDSPGRIFEDLLVFQRFEYFIDGRDRSVGTRVHMAREGIEMWTHAPIWGHGANQFRALSGFDTYSHNNYVELLSNLGLIGLALFYSIYVALILRARRNVWHGSLILMSLATLLLWEVALVSYSSRLQWVFLAVLTCLSMYRNTPAPGTESLWRPKKHPRLTDRTNQAGSTCQ